MSTSNGPTSISQPELDRILAPDMPGNHDQFKFGKHADGQPRFWKMKPLDFSHERLFRKHVMPMLGESFKPFEVLVMQMGTKYVTDLTPSFISSVFAQETLIDDHILPAMHAILFAQDKSVTIEWIEQQAASRQEMLNIIYEQCDLCKLMDNLGESLAGRLERLAVTMGVKIDLVSLRQLLKQLSEAFSDKILSASSTAVNAIGRSTENSNDITTQNFMPKTRSGIDTSLDEVNGPKN